jgi:hypothetical protein
VKQLVWGVLVLVVSVAAGLASLPQTTWAGTFTVSSCDRSTGNVNQAWLASLNSDPAHLDVAVTCPPLAGGTLRQQQEQGLWAADHLPSTTNSPDGAQAAWVLTAPAGTSVTHVSYDRFVGSTPELGWVSGLWADGALIDTCSASNGQCTGGGAYGDPTGDTAELSMHATQLRFGVRCSEVNSGGCLTGFSGHAVWASMAGSAVTITDNTPPDLGSPTGPLWGAGPAGGYHRGIEQVGFTPSDSTGIKQVSLIVDGQASEIRDQACDYTQVAPCPTLPNQTFNLDTNSLADGSHTIVIAAEDAAGNVAQLSHTIITDNTAPGPPAPVVAQGTDWQRSRTFNVTASAPAGQISPISAADYALCDAGASSCGPIESVTASSSTVTLPPITVAADGDWRLKLWMKDAAGNVNPAFAALIPLRVNSSISGTPAAPTVGPSDTPVVSSGTSGPVPNAGRGAAGLVFWASIEHRRGPALVFFDRVDPAAQGSIVYHFQALRGHLRIAAGHGTVLLLHGRGQVVIPLSHRMARDVTALLITAHYSGDRSHSPETVTRVLRIGTH